MTEASLNKADLTRVIMPGVNLDRANLDGANLCKAGLGGQGQIRPASLDNAHLKQTNLNGANLVGASMRFVNFYNDSDCSVDGCDMDMDHPCASAKGNGTQMNAAKLEGAYISGVDLTDVVAPRVRNFPTTFWTCRTMTGPALVSGLDTNTHFRNYGGTPDEPVCVEYISG